MIEIQDKKHSKISCSGLARVLNCPASLGAEAQANPDNIRRSSRPAAEGTVAHEVCDLVMESDGLDTPADYLGVKMSADGYTFEVNAEMVDSVNEYVDHIHSIKTRTSNNTECHSEYWGCLKAGGIEGFNGGTTDYLIVDFNRQVIEVIDFKYGAGVAVEVVGNSQLSAYALAYVFRLISRDGPDVDLYEWTVRLCIVQPRAYHKDGPIREWVTTGGEIMDWYINEVKPRLIEAQSPNPPFAPSTSNCRFCEASGNCTAQYEKLTELAIVDFAELADDAPVSSDALPRVTTLSTNQLLSIVQYSKVINKFLDNANAIVLNSLLNNEVRFKDSLKLVHGRAARKLNEGVLDPVTSPFLNYLDKSEIFYQANFSMTALEKAMVEKLGKREANEIFKRYVTRFDGKATVAPLADKRKSYAPPTTTAEDDFNEMMD